MNLNSNTVLITGGGSGIGFALAEHLLRAKSEVIICGRHEEKLLEAQRKHPELKKHDRLLAALRGLRQDVERLFAAMTPARCAAPPAPAMMHASPRLAAPSA